MSKSEYENPLMIKDITPDYRRGQKIWFTQQSKEADSYREMLLCFDNISDAIDAIRKDNDVAADTCPGECLPTDEFQIKKFNEWDNSGDSYWYGDSANLVVVTHEDDDYEYVPVCVDMVCSRFLLFQEDDSEYVDPDYLPPWV